MPIKEFFFFYLTSPLKLLIKFSIVHPNLFIRLRCMLMLQVVIGKDKQDFEQGDEIRLSCSVKGYPIPSIMWYRNNIPVQKNSRFSIDQQDNTLVITKTTTIDTGSYSCRYAEFLIIHLRMMRLRKDTQM